MKKGRKKGDTGRNGNYDRADDTHAKVQSKTKLAAWAVPEAMEERNMMWKERK